MLLLRGGQTDVLSGNHQRSFARPLLGNSVTCVFAVVHRPGASASRHVSVSISTWRLPLPINEILSSSGSLLPQHIHHLPEYRNVLSLRIGYLDFVARCMICSRFGIYFFYFVENYFLINEEYHNKKECKSLLVHSTEVQKYEGSDIFLHLTKRQIYVSRITASQAPLTQGAPLLPSLLPLQALRRLSSATCFHTEQIRGSAVNS